MTRKDYILLAGAFRHARELSENKPGKVPNRWLVPMEFVEKRVANALASDNPRFDREHFLAVVRGEKDLNSRPSRKGVHIHRPHNSDVMQTVCVDCREELDLR